MIGRHRACSVRRSAALLTAAIGLTAAARAGADDAPAGEPLGNFELLDGAPATVSVPAHANEALAVRDPKSGVGVVVRFVSAASKAGVPDPDNPALTEFTDPFGAGSALALSQTAEGVGLLVTLAPAQTEPLALRLDLEGTAGLRAVGGTVELLDASGAPRIRIAPQVQQALALDLGGCAHDDSPAPPWDRAPTPPGAAGCDALLTVPLLVALRIETTAKALLARSQHTTTLLGGDDQPARVVVIGGIVGSTKPEPSSTAELFDVSTGTFAATTPMANARQGHTATRLPDGRILVVGGYEPAAATTELFDPATGWAPGPALVDPRGDHSAVAVGDAVLVAGGFVTVHVGDESHNETLASVERIAPGGSTPLASMATARSRHTATVLRDDHVLIVGGQGSDGLAIGEAELWDGAAWHPAGSTGARTSHVACPLASGDVLVAGGQPRADPATTVVVDALRDALRFDLASSSFVPLPSLATRVTAAAWAPLGSRCLLTGGAAHTGLLAEPALETQMFDETTDTFAPTAPMHVERKWHTATALPGARVLVVGGAGLGYAMLGTAELFSGICLDDHTAPDAERAPIDCAPYACSAGACRPSCETVLDCVAGNVCDGAKCVPPTTTAEFGGCDCTTSGNANDAPLGWATALVAALAALVRRR